MLDKVFGKVRFKKVIKSVGISNEQVVKFLENPDAPHLISFPRTGSHWLRMLMELYLAKPSLVRVFYYFDTQDYSCYHWHDEDLKYQLVRNLMYLYREPVNTVFSQMMYHKEDMSNENRIWYWSVLYAKHVSKWALDENIAQRKILLSYDAMNINLNEEFKKVCDFFNVDFDAEKLEKASLQVSKENLKKRTAHDSQVVNIGTEYEKHRINFVEQNSEYIWRTFISVNSKLKNLF
jgi:hypothetical protein